MAYDYSQICDLVQTAVQARPQLTLRLIATQLGVERHTITAAIRATRGESFREFKNAAIARRAHELLCMDGTRSIKEISYDMGFRSPRSFERAILKNFQMTPRQIRSSHCSPLAKKSGAIYEAYLTESCTIASDTLHLRFRLREPNDFSFEAGQSIALLVPFDSRYLVRLYAIASPPSLLQTGEFDLCVKVFENGRISSWLSKLSPGDLIRFLGPFGIFVLEFPVDPKLVFIATGTGVVPIRSMLRHLLESNNTVESWLFLTARDEESLLYGREFEEIATQRCDFHFVPVFANASPGWNGHSGSLEDLVERSLVGSQHTKVYACGAHSTVDAIVTKLEQMGFPSAAIIHTAD